MDRFAVAMFTTGRVGHPPCFGMPALRHTCISHAPSRTRGPQRVYAVGWVPSRPLLSAAARDCGAERGLVLHADISMTPPVHQYPLRRYTGPGGHPGGAQGRAHIAPHPGQAGRAGQGAGRAAGGRAAEGSGGAARAAGGALSPLCALSGAPYMGAADVTHLP